MIDINKIVSDAIEAEVSKAVARILIGPGLQETVNSFIQTYLEDHPAQAPNLGQLRAQFAADIEQVLVRINNVSMTQNNVQKALNGASERFIRIEECMSGMQERFALKEVVGADIEGINRVLDTRASADSVENLEEQVGALRRKFNVFEKNGPELDSDELATTIAEMFQDGTLTITIDKV